MNYYDSLYGKPTSAVVMDKKSSSSTGEKVYVITCHDADSSLLELLQAVRDFGNCGHSFEIVVDPDAGKKKKSIFWDGDGSDRIDSITSTSAELDLRKVLLANINTIKWIVRGAIPDKNYPDDKLDDPIEALKKIECTCNTLLDGNGIDFGHGTKEMLDSLIENANRYIKNCDTPPSEKWTPKEDFEHLLWSLKHYYERMVESQKNDELDEGKPNNTSDGATLDSTDEQDGEVATQDEEPLKVGKKVKIKDNLRCFESGKPGVVVGLHRDGPQKGRLVVTVKMDNDGHKFSGYADSYIEGFKE